MEDTGARGSPATARRGLAQERGSRSQGKHCHSLCSRRSLETSCEHRGAFETGDRVVPTKPPLHSNPGALP